MGNYLARVLWLFVTIRRMWHECSCRCQFRRPREGGGTRRLEAHQGDELFLDLPHFFLHQPQC